MRAPVLALLLSSVGLATAQSETPSLTGTWKLDEGRSRVTAEAGMAGLVAAGAPEVLHVTHPENGDLVVESQVNESHARLYRPGAETTTPVFLGGAGSVTVTSRWEGNRLVAEGVREQSSEATAVREVFSLDAEGTLRIEISSKTHQSVLIYERTDDVGPCESWPTPCEKPYGL